MQVDVIHLSLGVEGFRVIACDERDDAIEVAIETTVPMACCPDCGHAEIVPKERKPLCRSDSLIWPHLRRASGHEELRAGGHQKSGLMATEILTGGHQTSR